MTNKCTTIINEETGETCGHKKDWHAINKECWALIKGEWCKCKKFTPEDESTDKIQTDKKGCGKLIKIPNGKIGMSASCGFKENGKIYLCPECQSKSEIEPKGNIKPSDTFCLKDEREDLFYETGEHSGFGYHEDKVKEFIKILKKDIPEDYTAEEFRKRIDKLAGDLG